MLAPLYGKHPLIELGVVLSLPVYIESALESYVCDELKLYIFGGWVSLTYEQVQKG